MQKFFVGILLAATTLFAQGAVVSTTGTTPSAPFSLVLASCDAYACGTIKIDNTGHFVLTGGKAVNNYLTSTELARLNALAAQVQESFDTTTQTCHSQGTPRPTAPFGATASYSVFVPALSITFNPSTSTATTFNVISFSSTSSAFIESFCDGGDFQLAMKLNVYANYLLGKYEN